MHLIEAIYRGDLAAVKTLLAQPIDLQQCEDADGVTALHHAVQLQQLEIVQCLLMAGADPLAETIDGITPLAIAEWFEDAAIEDLLQRAIRQDD